ncbi:MAG: flagellar biosynthesis anti-sigma factor FlgM [Spirochaetia bacterium]|nr:flagellar biosynthesis anti-sigma factor FlgM [Spirochaetia bacterium]MBQ3648031.1 flagellar biosynthesis anti-sigma factor FlgM [Spirochaetia bacterium]MBQ3713283.1 flagellar biosynthesis anti-sigma factor FlgM [Spirochaetia bacterium]MBR0319035.1 flagellar biosynthesis anti-sigma factor FlgM [Spirochaetia bacterium]
MTINNISGVNSINGCSGIGKTAPTVKVLEQDSISLSPEAKAMGDVLAISEELKSVPDIRMDKVEAAIQHLKDPDYINQSVINNVADKIVDMFGI